MNFRQLSILERFEIRSFIYASWLPDLKNVVNDKKKEAEQLIAREESTKSEAIISLLVNSELKGFLFFESVDKSTFSVDQSTDYLEFFAQVISKHLESLLHK